MNRTNNENISIPPKDNLYSKEQWRKIISDWEKSQETQKNYCARLNINLNTFVYWRGKFLTNVKPTARTNNFVPVIIKSNELKINESLIIENRYGNKLHVPISLNADQLEKLLKLVGF